MFTLFNKALFSALLTVSSNTETSLEDVLRVLSQSSDQSRLDSLNHNCRVAGLPFCWHYYYGNGEDRKETKVLSFPFVKISTGWCFSLDIEESGSLYISEGKGSHRTALRLSRLNDFSPSTRETLRKTVTYLCSCSAEKVDAEELFQFYKQTVNAEEETAYSVVKGDVQPSSVYRAFQVKGVPETRHLQYWSGYENPNPNDDALAEKPKKHIILVRWSAGLDRWYADFVFEDGAWGFSCMNDPSSYPIFDKSFKLDDLDGDGEVDQEWFGSKLPAGLRDELEAAAKVVASQKNAKDGTWIVAEGNCYRKWSQILEGGKIHLFVSPNGDSSYYDDIEELDFSPSGEKCVFRNYHLK